MNLMASLVCRLQKLFIVQISLACVNVLLIMYPLASPSLKLKVIGKDGVIFLFRLLAFAFGSSSAFDPLGLRSVDVVSRNPAFIVRLGA